MGTYYVRKTGNDGNLGTSPAQAWLTVDRAANNVAADDTVHIGSGIYRELVTMDTPGTSGNQISFIGDIAGEETGDAGPVIISAFDSETGAAARNYCLDMNAKEFIVWQYVIFDGGAIAAVGDDDAVDDLAYEGVEFLDCVFLAGDSYLGRSISLEINDGATPTTDGLQIKRCVIVGEARVSYSPQDTSDKNLKWNIENTIFFGHGSSASNGFELIATAALTKSVGGIVFNNCICWACKYGIFFDDLENTTNTCDVYNCYFFACSSGLFAQSCAVNTINEDYNHAQACNALESGIGVINGGNSDATVSGPILGGIADLMFYHKFGWSPWKPWEPMALRDGNYKTPVIDAASATHAPSEDLYGNPRPMKRNVDDIGAVEARERGQDETGTVYADSHSMLIAGSGYHDMIVPVAATLTTVAVQVRYDSNYAGNLPLLSVMNIPGVADQSDVMTAAADNWEELTCAFTPTSAGYVRVRLRSRDTSANGKAFFDALGVS